MSMRQRVSTKDEELLGIGGASEENCLLCAHEKEKTQNKLKGSQNICMSSRTKIAQTVAHIKRLFSHVANESPKSGVVRVWDVGEEGGMFADNLILSFARAYCAHELREGVRTIEIQLLPDINFK